MFPGLSEDCARDECPGGDLGQRELRHRQVSPKGEVVPVTNIGHAPIQVLFSERPSVTKAFNTPIKMSKYRVVLLCELLKRLRSIDDISTHELLLLFLSIPGVPAIRAYELFCSDPSLKPEVQETFLRSPHVSLSERLYILLHLPQKHQKSPWYPDRKIEPQNLKPVKDEQDQLPNAPIFPLTIEDDPPLSWADTSSNSNALLICAYTSLDVVMSETKRPFEYYSTLLSGLGPYLFCACLHNIAHRRLKEDNKLRPCDDLSTNLSILYQKFKHRRQHPLPTITVDSSGGAIRPSKDILENIWSFGIIARPSELRSTADESLPIAGGMFCGSLKLCLLPGEASLPEAIEKLCDYVEK
ncbi:hypothetical protein B0T10DRAFT_611493 [Thelonectria olida]|uniref:Uncharacterized protein n=1 Tax=Thelonectria olida TaxID=1576542 RepID=A0A9P8VSF6_9HYPO|nr:hypothetical protein B0T10DRAFT_611493 [Thelonectria olida]